MKRKMCCLVLCAALLISGCSLRFTLPEETEPQIWNESTGAVEQQTKPAAQPTVTAPQEKKPSPFYSPSAGYFYLGEEESDETPSFTYEGGELHVPFTRAGIRQFNEDSEICTNKCGFLLFLDGRPQPYKLTEDGEYQYMYMAQVEEGETGEFIFTPVTGQEGDNLEFYVLLVPAPDWGISDNPINAQIVWWDGSSPISNSRAAAATVRMNQTPEERTQPEITDHMKNLNISQGEWDNDDTQYTLKGYDRIDPATYGSLLQPGQIKPLKIIGIRHYAAMVDWSYIGTSLSGFEAWNYAYNVKENSEVPLRYVFQSDLAQELDLIVYINNVPVTVDPDKRITVTGGGKEKTIVDFTLDMAGCGDVAMVYMVAVSRNYWEGTERQNKNFGVYVLPAMYVLTPLGNQTELQEAMFPNGTIKP